MMLACRRVLPPVQPLMLSAKQEGIGYRFYSLWYDSDTPELEKKWAQKQKTKVVPPSVPRVEMLLSKDLNPEFPHWSCWSSSVANRVRLELYCTAPVSAKWFTHGKLCLMPWVIYSITGQYLIAGTMNNRTGVAVSDHASSSAGTAVYWAVMLANML